MDTKSRFRGALLGLACGDAVGTTVEFSPRGTFSPVTDMVGGGPFNLQAGQWTDDTSMALCLGTSLVERQGFDAHDQMRRYLDWMQHGYLSSTGHCFDIGNTTAAALRRFQQSGDPFGGSTDPRAAGNGSIMRLAPVPMFYYPRLEDVVHYSAESSRTTHGSVECFDACQVLGAMLYSTFCGLIKDEILFGDPFPKEFEIELTPKIRAITDGSYHAKSEGEISGSGYVVNSLEAALWCFWQTDNYRDAILRAVNLGDDADTTAAICGQLAGAYYGIDGIPEEWLKKLTLYDEIVQLADQLYVQATDA